MKKLFNYALLAAALLVGVNVNAKTIQVSAIGDLEQALYEAGDGDVVELSMVEPIVYMTKTVNFYAPAGTAVTLDLNGKHLKNADETKLKFLFYVFRGELTIKNGKIENTVGGGDGEGIIEAYGADCPQGKVYTKLILDKSLELVATGKNAVVLNERTHDYTSPYGVNEEFKKFSYWACNLEAEISCTISYATKYGIKLNGSVRKPSDPNYSSKIKTGTTVEQYMAAIPYIHVTKDANITAASDKPEACGIYCSGYGRYLIEGTITGATGVYIKGGEVTIDGANISSNSSTYYPADYKDGSSTSGKAAQGSAIIIEGSAGSVYSGGSVTVTGEAKINAGAGYAIEGLNLNPDAGASKIEGITVESGTINGKGGEGTINFSADVKENVTQAGTITGGTYDDNKINDVISDVKGAITPVTDEDGNTSYVVTPMAGGKTAAEARVLCDTTQATTDIMLKESLDLTATDAKCKNLVVETDATLTINNKLTVYGTLTIQGNVVVKAGATLIVEGNGITCLKASKFVIESAQAQSGMFYLNPNATGNFHPKATVEYYTEAVNGKRDRIGVPAYNGMQFKEIVRESPLSMLIFDNAIGWVPVTSVEQYLAPFQGLTISSTATSATTLKFPCELVGNTDADLKFYPQWNTFSNSYTAKADLTAFIREQFEAGDAALLEATIHKYDATNPNAVWDDVTLADLNEGSKNGELKPMQAIVIRNKTTQNGNIALSYTDNVWSCRPNAPATLGAPKFVQSNVNKAVINLTSVNGLTDKLTIREAAQFTEQFDNGADATKYPNSIFNMYVATEFGDLCQMASDNVEGQVITLATTTETEFTMSFSNVRGEKMALVDNMTGDVIEMAEGVEYHFMANANEVSERFTVVSAAKAPTAIENAAAKAKAAKFINNGQVILQNNGRLFNMLGVEVK